MDWKGKTLAHWGKINALAERRFGRSPLAEEAALAVIDGLEADNWRRLRAFSGQASFSSFIAAITLRLIEDFARKRFGRLRPPLWVQSFGGIWQKLFQVLCLERVPVDDAVEMVYQCQAFIEKNIIETAAYELLARIPDCGIHRGLEVSYEEESSREDDDTGSNLDSAFEGREQKDLFQAIFQLVLGGEEGTIDEKLLEKYRVAKLDLKAEEKILLKLCYQDGLGITEAGAMLEMNRFQVHGKMRRLLKRLHVEFERCGLADVLRSMLHE